MLVRLGAAFCGFDGSSMIESREFDGSPSAASPNVDCRDAALCTGGHPLARSLACRRRTCRGFSRSDRRCC